MPRKSRNTWRANRVQNLKDRNCSLTWPTKSRPMTGTREEVVEAEAEGVVEKEEEARVVRTLTLNIVSFLNVGTGCIHQHYCSPLFLYVMIFLL